MSEATRFLFGIHADALPLREQRLNAIASNLANADTPNYKARDIDFEAALKASGGGNGSGLATTDRQHLGLSTQGGAFDAPMVERNTSQPSLDGNTVDSDVEHAAFSRASLEYRASLSFIESRVRGLLTAITGQ